LADRDTEMENVRSLLDAIRRSGFTLEPASLECALRQRLDAVIDHWMRNPTDQQFLQEVEGVLALSRVQPFELNLWRSQNAYYELSRVLTERGVELANESWLHQFRELGQWLGISLPQLPGPDVTAHRHPAA